MARHGLSPRILLILLVCASCRPGGDNEPPEQPPGEPNAPKVLIPTAESLAFGEIPTPGEASQFLQLTNASGEQLDIELTSTGDAFTLLPPVKATLASGASASFEVRFSPKAPQAASGGLTVTRAGTDELLLQVPLSGTGLATSASPALRVLQPVLDFGGVSLGNTSTHSVLLENQGDGAALIERASFDESALRVVTPLPLLVPPGTTRSISVRFAPSAPGPLQSRLMLEGDAPAVALQVLMRGMGIEASPAAQLEPPTSLSLPATDQSRRSEITSTTQGAVVFQVGLPDTAAPGDSIGLTVSAQDGSEVTKQLVWDGSSKPAMLTLNLSTLASGPVHAEARLVRGTGDAALVSEARQLGATKVPADLAPPVLRPLPALTQATRLTVQGTAPNGALITVTGAAEDRRAQLPPALGEFSIELPLKTNAQNELQVCAELNGRVSCAVPVSVVHLVPNDMIVAEASSRRLSTKEVEQLVDAGVISLDDPANFHVAEFTVIIEVGNLHVPVTQPVVLGSAPGIYRGVPMGRGGGAAEIIVVKPPGDLPPIPGVIIIDGSIKSLKELFQVTFALTNLSADFTIEASAELRVPSGLTAIRAGLGDALGDIQVDSPVDSVPIMVVPPATGEGPTMAKAQFILRGDMPGLHGVRIDFGGRILGKSLDTLTPFEGSASAQVSVHGPPKLRVELTHPSHVAYGEQYPLFLTLTNDSPIPAHYATLELRVGGGAAFAEEGCPPPSPPKSRNVSLGHLEPGASRPLEFLLVSCLEGHVIGCRKSARGNVDVSVSTGVPCEDGSDPVQPTPPPAAPAPIVREASPSPHAVVAHSLGALVVVTTGELTQVTADRFATGYLEEPGTFVLERMDHAGQQVLERVMAHVETSFDPASERTTARLSPRQELRPDARYKATLVGGGSGVRDARNGQTLASDFTWTFRTAPVDDGITPVLVASSPASGARDVTPGAAVQLTFSERIAPSSIRMNATDYTQASFAVILGGTVSGGDVSGGASLSGRLTLSADGRTLTYQAEPPIPAGASVTVRVAGVTDVFGSPLEGTRLVTFATGPADSQPPAAPVVNALPRYTAGSSVPVTGNTEPYALVRVSGGSAPASARAGAMGKFTVLVPLAPNQDHVLSLAAEDLNGNQGPASDRDTSGALLLVGRDATAPTARILSPASGSQVRGTVTVKYESEDALGPGVDRVMLTSGGLLLASSDTATGQLTVNTESLDNGIQRWSLWARDGSGNWTQTPAEIQLTVTNPLFPRIDSVSTEALVAGTGMTLLVHGANVNDAVSVSLTPAGISVLSQTPKGADLQVKVNVPWDLQPGPAVLTVTNAFGESRTDIRGIPLHVVTPAPSISTLEPARLLAGPAPREIKLKGSGFTPASEVVVNDRPLPATVSDGNTLSFTLLAAHLASAGTHTVVVRTPDPRATYRYSGQRTLEVVVPKLGFELPSVSLVPGESLDVGVTLSEPAQAGGHPVSLALVDPQATLSPSAGTVTIAEGERRAVLSLAGVRSGATATLTASNPFALQASLLVTVTPPPSPVLPEAPLDILPRVSEPFRLALDAPAPTAGRSVALDVSDGGALVPTRVDFQAGTTSKDVTLEGLTPGDYMLTATSSDGTTDTVGVRVRQAIARSNPEVIRASTLRNQVKVRVATNGSQSLHGVRIEVPTGWSTPSELHAKLGDGTNLSASLVRGELGEGPNGGTLVGLVLPTPITPTDSTPWLEVVFEKMTAFEVFGISTWPVEVDNGSGYAPILDNGVHIRVEGTAADGAGVADLTTHPSPLVEGTANASFTLTLDNNVELVTEPATIFNEWTKRGTPLNWHLYDHPEYGTILRTTDNLNPGYFTSTDDLSDGTIELQIGALETSDDDFIGLVFRWVDECNYYLLDWKQRDQTLGSQNAKAGLALRRITNCDYNGDGVRDSLDMYWDNTDDPASPRPDVLAADLGVNKGWQDNTFHALKVVLNGSRIDVYIDGASRLSVDDPSGFASGRYGPYAYSQAYTSIRNLKVSRTSATINTIELELPPGWPALTAEQFTLNVAGVDRSADVVLGGTGATGGTLLTLPSAGLLPERRYTLTVSGFTAPPAGSYPLTVRTAGRAGRLVGIEMQPVITVQ